MLHKPQELGLHIMVKWTANQPFLTQPLKCNQFLELSHTVNVLHFNWGEKLP